MQILASKFIYFKDQENLLQILEPFRNLSIQLAFFQKQEFLKIDHKILKETCQNFNIKIPTVHAPTTDVFDQEFLEVLEFIKKTYKVKIISIHPQRGELPVALAKLEEYAKIIEDLDIILAYENFPSSVAERKWIYKPFDMYTYFNLPFLKLTFDTSHLDLPSECIEEFKSVEDKVAVIHLSDKNDTGEHLPLGSGNVLYQEFLELLKTHNFKGLLVLEYMDEYEKKVIVDAKLLKEKYEGSDFNRG